MLTVVVPIFNEFESLIVLLEELHEIQDTDCVFYFVDNGSEDPRILETLKNSKSPIIRYERIDRNAGFGGAVAHVVRRLDTEFVGWMPGNLKVRLADAIKTYRVTLAHGAECGKSRRIRTGILNKAKTFSAGLFLSLYFGKNMMDSGGTPTCIRLSLFKPHLDSIPNGVEFDAFVSFLISSRKIITIRPRIPYGDRLFGESHWQRGLKSEISLLIRIAASKSRWSMAMPVIE